MHINNIFTFCFIKLSTHTKGELRNNQNRIYAENLFELVLVTAMIK